jgi:HTH-type transcriptional regulator / antitoxin HigA
MSVETRLSQTSTQYLALLNEFPPRPIRSDEQHRRAVEVVNALLDRTSLTADEEDYLDVLEMLIADYEASVYEHPEFTPVERLRYLMEEHAISPDELARRTGIVATSLSDILNGERRIGLRLGAKLAQHFDVSASFFA